jgi:hypothetical protein
MLRTCFRQFLRAPTARWGVAAILALLSTQATASIVRCTAADGHVTYQDRGCPSGVNGEPVDATPNQGFRFATREQIEKARRPPPEEWQAPPVKGRKTNVRQAFNAGERRFISPGMTDAEVKQRIGPPDRVTYKASSYSKRPNKDTSRQWFYLPAADDPQTTTVLTLKGGVVTHVERKVAR